MNCNFTYCIVKILLTGFKIQVLDGKEEVEKQHRENIKKLNSVVERQEKDLGRFQVDMDELEENNRSIQSALDNAYK
jgi:hypothetical protein